MFCSEPWSSERSKVRTLSFVLILCAILTLHANRSTCSRHARTTDSRSGRYVIDGHDAASEALALGRRRVALTHVLLARQQGPGDSPPAHAPRHRHRSRGRVLPPPSPSDLVPCPQLTWVVCLNFQGG